MFKYPTPPSTTTILLIKLTQISSSSHQSTNVLLKIRTLLRMRLKVCICRAHWMVSLDKFEINFFQSYWYRNIYRVIAIWHRNDLFSASSFMDKRAYHLIISLFEFIFSRKSQNFYIGHYLNLDIEVNK